MGDINWGVQNSYSTKEYDQLRGHESDSTSTIMNDVRKASVANAGAPVAIRGDDKSAKELREEDRSEFLKEFGAHAVAEDLAVDAVLERVGEVAEAPVAFAEAAWSSAKSSVHAMNMGDELAKAVQGDNMQRAMLSQLNLPTAFKQDAMDRFTERETEGSQSGASLMTTKLHTDPAWHAKVAVLQLHCDQGMNAARSLIDSGALTPDTFMKHPDIAKKYGEDPAFKAGFDCVMWAHKAGKETYGALCTEIDARDARYDANHVAWRG